MPSASNKTSVSPFSRDHRFNHLRGRCSRRSARRSELRNSTTRSARTTKCSTGPHTTRTATPRRSKPPRSSRLTTRRSWLGFRSIWPGISAGLGIWTEDQFLDNLNKDTKAGERKRLAKARENSLHKSKEFVIPSASEESPLARTSIIGRFLAALGMTRIKPDRTDKNQT
jgi:hypothetical protein